MKTQNFTTVSEWIEAKNTKFYILENIERESEKAMAFNAKKFNSCGNLVPAICWIPKKFIQIVQNDFYTHGAKEMYLIPDWLYVAKMDEGYEF